MELHLQVWRSWRSCVGSFCSPPLGFQDLVPQPWCYGLDYYWLMTFVQQWQPGDDSAVGRASDQKVYKIFPYGTRIKSTAEEQELHHLHPIITSHFIFTFRQTGSSTVWALWSTMRRIYRLYPDILRFTVTSDSWTKPPSHSEEWKLFWLDTFKKSVPPLRPTIKPFISLSAMIKILWFTFKNYYFKYVFQHTV